MREEVGVDNLCWGSDYPHYEGTWPETTVALRNTFGELPESDTRKILGLNAVTALHLDRCCARTDRPGHRPDTRCIGGARRPRRVSGVPQRCLSHGRLLEQLGSPPRGSPAAAMMGDFS